MVSGLENPFHWLILLVIILIVMGPKRLPEVGRSLGTSIRHFKSSLDGHLDGHDDAPAPAPTVTQAAAPADPEAPAAQPVAAETTPQT